MLRYINGYTTFLEGFGYGFLLWTVVNLFDAVVLDIIWFCHDPQFVIKGTEDMIPVFPFDRAGIPISRRRMEPCKIQGLHFGKIAS